MATNELITDIANVALALSFIIGLVFGIAEVRLASKERRERLALDTLRNFQTREFSELMNYVLNCNLPLTHDHWDSQPFNQQIFIIQFAQEMESLGLLVAEKLLDITLVDKTLGSLVTTAWEKYKILFMDIRINRPDPFLGEYFQWLAEQLKTRLEKHPRKPFYQS